MSISSAFSAELEINSVVHKMIQRAKHHMEAERCNLFLFQDGQLVSKFLEDGDNPFGIPLANYVINTGEILNLENIAKDSRFSRTIQPPTTPTFVNVLCVPILSNDQTNIMGVVEFINKVGTFTKEDEEIAQLLARHAGIAYSNSQLYAEALEAQKKIKVLLDITTALTSELETNSVITTIMTKAKDLLDAERCTLFMVDHEQGELWSTIASGAKEIRVPLYAGIAGL